MARIFSTVVKRIVTSVAGGVANVLSDQRAGISVAAVVEVTAARQATGLTADLAPVSVVAGQASGMSVSATLVTAEPAKADQRAGLSAEGRLTAAPVKNDQRGAVSVVKQIVTLTRRVGGNGVTESAVGGRTDWASDANVISGTNGLHDGVNATFAGNALGARGGRLDLTYPDAANKRALNITSAKLYFYGSVAGTTLNNADVQLQYEQFGAGAIALETITGNADFSTAPKEHDITSVLNFWTGHDAMRAFFHASAALGELWTATADACELEIIASYNYTSDASDNWQDGAVTGRTLPTLVSSPFSGFGNALQFDGVDRDDASQGIYLGTGQDFAIRGRSGSFTIDAKVQPASVHLGIIAARSAAPVAATRDWNLFLHSNGSGVNFTYLNNSDTMTTLAHNVAYLANDLITIRVTWDGTTMTLLVNGSSVATSTAAIKSTQATIGAYIGRTADTTLATAAPNAFNGIIDEVRFSDVVRSDSTAAPFTSDADTVALLHCDDLVTN